LKTKQNNLDVEGFLNNVQDEEQRRDSFTVLELMKKVSNLEPACGEVASVGFGKYITNTPAATKAMRPDGFSPRKGNLALYISPGFERYPHLLSKLGKHKTGKACLYIKRLKDVDWGVGRDRRRITGGDAQARLRGEGIGEGSACPECGA